MNCDVTVYLFKIIQAKEWLENKDMSIVFSEKDKQDGFMHLSREDQLASTIEKLKERFKGEAFVAVKIASEVLLEHGYLSLDETKSGGKYWHLYVDEHFKGISREKVQEVVFFGV